MIVEHLLESRLQRWVRHFALSLASRRDDLRGRQENKNRAKDFVFFDSPLDQRVIRSTALHAKGAQSTTLRAASSSTLCNRLRQLSSCQETTVMKLKMQV